MTTIDPDGLRYILDHVTRQCGEVKSDIRTEVGILKSFLDREMHRQELSMQALREEIDKRLALMDERIIDLQKFKWQAAGVVAFIIVAIEIAVYWSHIG